MTPLFDEAVAAFQRGDLDRARALGEQLLATGADSAGLDHLLGLIDCRTGQLGSGVERLRRALDRSPGDVSVRVMLARALVDAGSPAEALEIARPPGGTSPAELALWHVRAEAATVIEAWPEAAVAWDKVCVVRPKDWRAWSNLGNALGELGRWREAVQALERAVALNSNELSLRRNLAGALNNDGRLEEAVWQLRRCIDAAPDDKTLRISLALILADLGRDKESQSELDKAAQLAGEREAREDGVGLLRIAMNGSGGVDVIVLREFAYLLERTNRMDALAKVLEDAESLGVAPEQVGYPAAANALQRGDPAKAKRLLLTDSAVLSPLRWHWLMARIEDGLGDSSAAFAEAEAMNRSFQDYDEWRREGAVRCRATRRLAETIRPAWAGQLRTLAADGRGQPMFVVGFPRSGTTLLDTFIRGHPETTVMEELPLVRAAETALGEMTDLPQRSSAELVRARDAYFAELHRHLGDRAEGLLIDKLPLNMLAVPIIHSLFPDTRFIFAQRHPCDVVLSCFMQAFALNSSMAPFLDIEDAATFYDAAMTVWTRSCDAFRVKVRTVVYEELVADPEATLRPAIEFLGLDWREELLDHRATAKARRLINTPSYNQVIQPLSKTPSGRWRRYEKQLDPVLPVLLPWAKRLGYED